MYMEGKKELTACGLERPLESLTHMPAYMLQIRIEPSRFGRDLRLTLAQASCAASPAKHLQGAGRRRDTAPRWHLRKAPQHRCSHEGRRKQQCRDEGTAREAHGARVLLSQGSSGVSLRLRPTLWPSSLELPSSGLVGERILKP